jgi:hypothetical protein
MDDQPVARFQTADAVLKSDRQLAGPLRYGTMPPVGPKGGAVIGAGSSDFGMDRITPRGFDPMGTSLRREPNQESSTLISREIRGRR